MLCQPEDGEDEGPADDPAKRGIDHAIVDFTSSPNTCKEVETKEGALEEYVRVERRTVLRTRRVKYVSPSSSIMKIFGKKKSKGRRQ